MRRFFAILSLVICLNASGEAVFARPEIGVALGGGGARGFAHVGVLRALEEMNIPVDYIAGTSMGAIVGGLYASGKTLDEIEELLLTINWADVFSDSPPYRELSFRRKEDVNADLIDFGFGIKDWQLRVPAGLVFGQKFRFILQTNTLHTEGVDSFDDLPIAFRAVATDIETGDMVVLNKGNLAEAIHASFAIPGVINPVEIDGKLLVDGGLVSQVPIQTVRDMGADIVIASSVSSGILKREELSSFAAVTMQVINLMIHKNETEEISGADVLISPDLKGYSATDFEKADEIIPLGVVAVEQVADLLKPYSMSKLHFDRNVSQNKIAQNDSNPVLVFMDIHNNSSVSNKWILENMQTSVGKELDLAVLNKDLEWLYQTNEFEIIDFRVIHRGTKTGLDILTREKPWGNDNLRFGLSLADNFEGDSHYTFNFRYTNTRINKLGAEWRTDIQIGREGLLKTEFYQPLAYRTNHFISAIAYYNRYNTNIFEDNKKTADYRVYQYVGQLDYGLELGKYGEVRLGSFIGKVNTRLSSGKALDSEQNIDPAGFWAGMVLDQINDPGFPTEGNYLAANYTISNDISNDEGWFQKFTTTYKIYHKRNKNILFSNISIGTKIGKDLPFHLKYRLGGPFSLTGYANDEIVGQYMAVLRTGYFRQISFLPVIMGTDLYFGAYAEAGNAIDDMNNFEFNDLIFTGNIFIGLDTFLGPLFLGYGLSDSGRESVHLRLGRVL